MNRKKTRISTRSVENHIGRKATKELIRAIEEKNVLSVSRPKEYAVVVNVNAIDGTPATKEE